MSVFARCYPIPDHRRNRDTALVVPDGNGESKAVRVVLKQNIKWINI